MNAGSANCYSQCLTAKPLAQFLITFRTLVPPQTQGVFNAAKRLTEKMRQKGMVTRKNDGTTSGGVSIEDGGGDGGEEDYEIREDGVELTEKDVVRRKTGTWATVQEETGGQGEAKA